MAILIPPPPTNSPQGDRVWTDWYLRLREVLSSTAGLAWNLVDKTGSSLSDIVTRNHAQLNAIAGTGANHISNAEAAVVTSVTATGHQGLASINGTGNNHISNAEATAVTAIQTSGHQGLTSINGTGNYHVSAAEATRLTDLNTSGYIPLKSGAANPTTTDVTAGNCVVWKNTTATEIRLWVNDGGVMFKSAALT